MGKRDWTLVLAKILTFIGSLQFLSSLFIFSLILIAVPILQNFTANQTNISQQNQIVKSFIQNPYLPTTFVIFYLVLFVLSIVSIFLIKLPDERNLRKYGKSSSSIQTQFIFQPYHTIVSSYRVSKGLWLLTLLMIISLLSGLYISFFSFLLAWILLLRKIYNFVMK